MARIITSTRATELFCNFMSDIVTRKIPPMARFYACVLSAGAYLLSPSETTSTIGTSGLDCRVRKGIGYDPTVKAPAPNTQCIWLNIRKFAKVLSANNNCATQSSARETGRISTPRLRASRHFHLEPINLVIS